jgi:hypothetical protein
MFDDAPAQLFLLAGAQIGVPKRIHNLLRRDNAVRAHHERYRRDGTHMGRGDTDPLDFLR